MQGAIDREGGNRRLKIRIKALHGVCKIHIHKSTELSDLCRFCLRKPLIVAAAIFCQGVAYGTYDECSLVLQDSWREFPIEISTALPEYLLYIVLIPLSAGDFDAPSNLLDG